MPLGTLGPIIQVSREEAEAAPLPHWKHLAREAEEELGSLLDEDGNILDAANSDRVEELGALSRRVEAESRLTPMVAIDGELMPLSEAEAFAGFKEPEIAVLAIDIESDRFQPCLQHRRSHHIQFCAETIDHLY